jgi:hypothetical protein
MPQHHFSIPIVIEVLNSRVQREARTDRGLTVTVVSHYAIRAHGEEPPDDWVSFPPPSAATRTVW